MTHEIPSGFVKGERFQGFRNTRGQKAGIEQNWGYYATDQEGKECALMYCNPGIFTIIDREVVDRIRVVHDKQVSWYRMKTGYVGCHTVINEKSTCLTLHQVLMNHYGHGKEGPSIDHINRNKLDNRLHNLRITTQSVQNTNRGKVGRHRTAKELPHELDDEKLPMFVIYYKENLGKNGENHREFFTVEGHPLQRQKEKGEENEQTRQLKSRRWATTKSNAVSINQKLDHAKAYVAELYRLMENPGHILTPPTIKISQKEKTKKEEKEEKKEEKKGNLPLSSPPAPPKQWKSSMIHRAIQNSQENEYKAFCEENNDMSLLPNWVEEWATFVLSVKGKTEADALPLITAFVENLRRIRHNKLCFDKNATLVDKEDRQQWPATTVVRAFLDGKLASFKNFTEAYTNESPADPKWVKRWTAFVDSLENARDDQDKMKTLCSKFMTAQRTKKYRHSKAGTSPAGTSGAGTSPAGATEE